MRANALSAHTVLKTSLRGVLSLARTPALAIAALSWCSPSVAQAQASSDRRTPTIERGVDESIAPGDDFFAYATGAWLQSTAIPAGKDHWNARDEIEELTRRRVSELLEDARSAPRGSTARKVADYRAAYMNEAAIEARGLGPIRSLLDSIDRIRDETSLTRALGAGVRADVDPINWGVYNSSHELGLSVEEGIHGEKKYVAFLVQGGLGLPDREDYVSSDSSKVALRLAFRTYTARQLAAA